MKNSKIRHYLWFVLEDYFSQKDGLFDAMHFKNVYKTPNKATAEQALEKLAAK